MPMFKGRDEAWLVKDFEAKGWPSAAAREIAGERVVDEMSEDEALVEHVARAMYWQRANPDKGHVLLDVAVMRWEDLLDEHRPGLQLFNCKQFWRDAARAALAAVDEADPGYWERRQALKDKRSDIE